MAVSMSVTGAQPQETIGQGWVCPAKTTAPAGMRPRVTAPQVQPAFAVEASDAHLAVDEHRGGHGAPRLYLCGADR